MQALAYELQLDNLWILQILMVIGEYLVYNQRNNPYLKKNKKKIHTLISIQPLRWGFWNLKKDFFNDELLFYFSRFRIKFSFLVLFIIFNIRQLTRNLKNLAWPFQFPWNFAQRGNFRPCSRIRDSAAMLC